jgi:hypothetical protein
VTANQFKREKRWQFHSARATSIHECDQVKLLIAQATGTGGGSLGARMGFLKLFKGNWGGGGILRWYYTENFNKFKT